MTQHNKNKQTPTETIQKWIRDFVTKPNPMFGDLPPCPYAQRAIIDGRVEFLELDGVADYPTLSQHIGEFDFDEKDVLVMIAEPDHSEPGGQTGHQGEVATGGPTKDQGHT